MKTKHLRYMGILVIPEDFQCQFAYRVELLVPLTSCFMFQLKICELIVESFFPMIFASRNHSQG